MKYQTILLFVLLGLGLNTYSQNNINQKSAREAPEWISHGVMYQIWPRSFTVEGTLSAATKKLPEIAELGATIVYVCPVMLQDRDINRDFWSPRQQASPASNPRNPYRIMDYTKVDPEYGTDEDLKEFIKTAHYLGLRVLMDLVYLHTGPSNVLIQNPEYYKRDEKGNFIKNHWNFYDLNYGNRELREFLLNTVEEWIRKYDFDGWRCDVSARIPVDFWEEARRRMGKIKPDIGMLAESNAPDEQLEAFDVSYGTPWFHGLKNVIANGEPAGELRKSWEFLNNGFPRGARFIRFVDNHDQFRPEIVFSKKGSMAANVLNFTIDGVPFIYNGQEIGDASPYGIMYYPEKSYNDNGAINWNAQFIPHQKELRNWYKRLIALRKSENALLEGETLWLKTDNPESAVAFLRKTDNETIIVVVNVSNRKIKVNVELQDVTGNKEIKPKALFFSGKDEITRLNGKNVTLSLGSFGYYVGKF
jgi:glycosidase